jgi:hypothetical protein
MKQHTKPLKPKALGVIGRDHLVKRFQDLDCEMETFDYRRQIGFDDQNLPFVAEAAFAWRMHGPRRMITGINWAPGIVNPFRELGKYGQSLDSVLEQQRSGSDEPIVYLLHLVCPRPQFTDRGKSAVALDGETSNIQDEEE